MKKIILAAMCAAAPAAAQVRLQAPAPGLAPIIVPGLSFDGASPLMTPALAPAPLVATPAPGLIAPVLPAPSVHMGEPGEASLVPSWIDARKLSFDALMPAGGGGGIAVLRYGWRGQYEMGVFAFPGNQSVSFREHSSNPMGSPVRAHEARLKSAAARREIAKILREANARNPVAEKDRAALAAILAILEGA